MNIFWSTLALERVNDIADYIAQTSRQSAERWIEDLFASVQRLQQFPESGRIVPELRRSDIREILHKGYRVIYRIREGRVEILTVRHSRQVLDEGDLEG